MPKFLKLVDRISIHPMESKILCFCTQATWSLNLSGKSSSWRIHFPVSLSLEIYVFGSTIVKRMALGKSWGEKSYFFLLTQNSKLAF